MDKTDKLIFFNKEGYPYNFQYDDINNKWDGKILFDENSNTLFKTSGIYIFEKVDSFDLSNVFDFEPSQLFNNSGLTFVAKTYDNEIVNDIKRVNENSDFYTKWIYGEDFDNKFRSGTIISFDSGTTETIWPFWDDFINTGFTYFNVIGTKKDAILIQTKTNNASFSGFYFTTGVTISSHNIIKMPDYGNEYLASINNLDFYPDKKLNIVNSQYNDKIVTYRDYSILRDKVFDFNLSGETTGKLDVKLTLYTERPKLYSGPVEINITNNTTQGTEIKFFNDINNDIEFFSTGQTIIFENYDGDGFLPSYNPIFTITGFKDKELIISTSVKFLDEDNRYFIYIDGITELSGISFMDNIILKSNPFIDSETLHNDREFEIISIKDTYPNDNTKDGIKIEVEQYVINESGYTYEIYKVFKRSQIQTLYAQQGAYNWSYSISGNTICYSTSNVVNISQDILLSGNTEYYYENTINAINERYKDYLDIYGVHLFHHNYSGVNYLIAEGIYEYNFNPYFNIEVYKNGIPLTIDNKFTFLSSGTTGYRDSDVYYFQVDEQLNNESIYLFESEKLSRNFKAEILMDLNNDLVNYGFKITLNNVEYYINYKDDTESTINLWIEKYFDVFDKLGFNVTGNTNTLIIEGKYPNVEVVDFDVFVNIYSDYSLDIQRNNGIVISSNQIRSINANLFDYELSTGMVISINNSKYPLNNKDYNIIRVTEDIIQLSYQGPFFYEYFGEDNPIDITVNEFIRKPRSYYNKIVDYKISWVEPDSGLIDEDIFFYDFSGNQLKPYNNMSGLTYIGPKPLYDENSNVKVFLNREPNKFEEQITNPSAQQTIFDNITYRLEMLNDSDSYNYVPVPLEIFLGFYSEKEGVSTNEMKIEKVDYAIFSGKTITNNTGEYDKNFIISGNTISFITNDYIFDLFDYGFETDQIIDINFIDTSETGQTIYEDYNFYRIKEITRTKIYIDTNYSGELLPFNTLELYNYSGKTFNFEIKSIPREICKLKIYGQSEIEDERLDINLRNLGINIYKEAEFIFKESDIQEHSVDYIRLNRKRKEMLSIYPEIFNYIGSYKSLIHAIDYFGYNDLKLYEYYKNIKPNSPLYGKLQKILIPDIFDNSVDGWTVDDFIQTKYDKGFYKKTNLFNLTYRITDEFGNYSLQYSLDDVQTKLMALVKWLRRNIIPLSSNIRDITGVADVIHDMNMRYDSSNWVSKSVIDDEVIGVNFYYTTTRINENNYLLTINFYILDGYEKPEYYTVRIKTFSLDKDNNELIPQTNQILYKTDYEPYTMNLNLTIDPFVLIETTSYNGYGAGYSNSKMFKYDILKNFYLVNSNFTATSFPYVNGEDGYYIIDDGRYYIIKY